MKSAAIFAYRMYVIAWWRNKDISFAQATRLALRGPEL